MTTIKCLWCSIFLKKVHRFRCIFRVSAWQEKIVYKKPILKECVGSHSLDRSIFRVGIYMSVSKPSICFWIQVMSVKGRKKLLFHNINLAGHRKSACCLQLLIFLEIWVNFPFWHCRTQVFPKSYCHHDLKKFCEIEDKTILLNIIENRKER